MPKRDADLLIEDMRVAIGRIERYTAGLDREAFLQDEKTVDAVVRNLEVRGVAARQMPSKFLGQHPEIPWPLIAGLRNRIVHDYFGLDLQIIWEIVSHDLPSLKVQLENL